MTNGIVAGFVDQHGCYMGKSAEDEAGSGVVLESAGCCATCGQDVRFVARHEWLRDHFLCSNCGSIPRERALMLTIETFFPNWRDLVIHESSPSTRGASMRIARESRHLLTSQFFPECPSGTEQDGVRCEDLEALTFADASIDLHITQDVLEHLFDPAACFREIARTLKPGGAHIFTVPIVKKNWPSSARARIDAAGKVTHLLPAEYHGNPVSEEGSLVTIDWGYDICRHIFESSGLYTQLIHIDDLSKGIRAELNEVLVTFKPTHPVLEQIT